MTLCVRRFPTKRRECCGECQTLSAAKCEQQCSSISRHPSVVLLGTLPNLFAFVTCAEHLLIERRTLTLGACPQHIHVNIQPCSPHRSPYASDLMHRKETFNSDGLISQKALLFKGRRCSWLRPQGWSNWSHNTTDSCIDLASTAVQQDSDMMSGCKEIPADHVITIQPRSWKLHGCVEVLVSWRCRFAASLRLVLVCGALLRHIV